MGRKTRQLCYKTALEFETLCAIPARESSAFPDSSPIGKFLPESAVPALSEMAARFILTLTAAIGP